MTGATSGIGEAIAKLLRDTQAEVVWASRPSERLAALSRNGELTAEFDLRDQSSIRRMFETLKSSPKRLDYIFHAAGTCFFGDPADAQESDIQNLLEVNFISTLRLLNEARGLLRSRPGALTCVLLGSLAGSRVEHSMALAAYAASKEAMIGYLRCAKRTLESEGLHIRVACPSGVRTNIARHSFGGDALDTHLSRGVLESPEEVAKGILDGIDGPLEDGNLRILPTDRARQLFTRVNGDEIS